MRRRKYKYLIIILILLFISVGFAYLTSTLDIVGIGHLKKASWKIYFDNVNIVEGENLSSNPPTTSNHNTTSVSYTVNLTKPGDTYKFYIDIVNNGTIDAMVSLIDENTILTSDQSKYASYFISYIDGTPIQENNFLGRHSKETLQIIIKYKKDVTSSDLPTSQMNLSFNLRLTYRQAKNADSRTGESTIITDLSGNGNDGIMYGGRVNADGTVYLDGVDDYINCGLENYDFGDGATLVAKVKVEKDVTSARYILNKHEGGGLGISLHSNNNETYALSSFHINGSYQTNGWRRIIINSWYILVATYDGNLLKFYSNGTQFDNGTSVDGPITTVSVPLLIGANPKLDGTAEGFTNITISDALIFDRALTAEEIASNYASTINPTNTSNMLLRYQFKNTTVKDLSGNGNDGTIYGDPKINSDGTLTTDGIDDYVDCGLVNYNFGNSITLIARVKVNELTSHNNLVIGNWENGGGGIFYDTTSLQFDYTNSATSDYVRYLTSFTPTLNTWYTIVGTYDGQKYKLYQNGKEVPYRNTENNYEKETTGNLISNYKFFLAANPSYNGNHTNFSKMTYSDILIFDRAVTKDEVINDYSKIISPSNREDLLLYYHFG
ncbi:MAG: LamG domain-containing protein [Bacilli bacterium]|nr:LamG domain-containing protein [Bacilli bacterium]